MLFASQISDLKALMPWNKKRNRQKALRALIEQRRRVYPSASAASDSAAIIAQIERMRTFQDARTVLLYYPIHNEVDLRPLLTKYGDSKTLLLPVTHRHSMEVRPYQGEESLRHGKFHVPEPQTKTYQGPIDLIFVPGVVFDIRCHRIGRGGGYYDRFLKQHREAKKVGVCYDFQLQHTAIPQLWHDKSLDRVVTPTVVIRNQ